MAMAVGNDMANRFSDKVNSHKSSLGFYITDNIYYGQKWPLTYALDGTRALTAMPAPAKSVVHAADYVSPGTIGVTRPSRPQRRLPCSIARSSRC